jgi:xanthine permease
MNNMAGGQGSPTFGQWENLFLGLLTLLSVILLNRFGKGFIQSISVLLAMVIGTITAWFMGLVDLSHVADASWFRIVQPFYFGVPEFHVSSIITMSLVAIVSMIESTGVFMALADICDENLEGERVKKGLRAEGLAIMIGGLFNSFPYTSFSQNVGLVALSKVKSRAVVIAAGIILIVLGLLPKVAAVTTIIPNAVLGGAMIPMFGMVIVSGIRALATIDFKQTQNLLIVACSVGMGLGTSVVPAIFKDLPDMIRVVVENGIVLGSLTAIVLNIIFNKQAKPSAAEVV